MSEQARGIACISSCDGQSNQKDPQLVRQQSNQKTPLCGYLFTLTAVHAPRGVSRPARPPHTRTAAAQQLLIMTVAPRRQ